MAATDPVKPAAPAAPKAESRAEGIPCIAARDFYSSEGAYVTEGTPFVYTPKEGVPFPFGILRPIDERQAAEAEEEFLAFKEAKYAAISRRQSVTAAIEQLSASKE